MEDVIIRLVDYWANPARMASTLLPADPSGHALIRAFHRVRPCAYAIDLTRHTPGNASQRGFGVRKDREGS